MPTDSSIWDRVHDVWRRSNILIRPGVTQNAIAAFEAKYDIAMPTVVLEYFSAADGTGDETDEGLYRFWRLVEVRRVHDVLVSDRFIYPDRNAYPGCFVFADLCIQG